MLILQYMIYNVTEDFILLEEYKFIHIPMDFGMKSIQIDPQETYYFLLFEVIIKQVE